MGAARDAVVRGGARRNVAASLVDAVGVDAVRPLRSLNSYENTALISINHFAADGKMIDENVHGKT